jgi:hypothetical protein
MDPAFRDLLGRLDLLPARAQELRSGVCRAIELAKVDSEMALIRTRKVLELMVRRLFEHHVEEPAGTRPLENMLQRLVKDEHLPRTLSAYANSVRELGNVAAHSFGEPVTPDDVHRSILQLLPILEWYVGRDVFEPPGTALPALSAVAAAPKPPSEPLAARLVLRAEGGPEEVHCVFAWRAELGRSSECAYPLPLAPGRVSNRHAELCFFPEVDKFGLRDLHSRNGTLVDGLRVEGLVYLRTGEQVDLAGQLPLQFRRDRLASFPVGTLAYRGACQKELARFILAPGDGVYLSGRLFGDTGDDGPGTGRAILRRIDGVLTLHSWTPVGPRAIGSGTTLCPGVQFALGGRAWRVVVLNYG